ncbi:cadherin-1 [Salmo salar]|uniref:Cadherin-1 n=1 Tax=Salmo salar TaxID=8030 RepID=A0A1S3MMR8_SALSA|nr:cadherin-1 [Salmo salar]
MLQFARSQFGFSFFLLQYTSSVPENQMPALVVVMAVTDADYPIHHPGGAGSELYRETPMASSTTPLDPLETRESSPPPRITMIWTMRVLLCSVCWWWWRMRWWSLVDSDLHVDSDLVLYTATDPDTTMTQTVRYRMASERSGWLSLNETTGQLQIRNPMDRESPFVTDGTYTALILAIDNGEVPATGTWSLVIKLEDVNDNAPTIDPLQPAAPVAGHLRQRPRRAQPFKTEQVGLSQKYWSARMNDSHE